MIKNPPPPDFTFFCDVYRDWRAATGASQDEVARRGGPSDTLQTAIERGGWTTRRPATTLRKVDVGFGWPEGTARDVLYDGFNPLSAGWPNRLDPDIEQVSRATSTGEVRLQRWETDPRAEKHPPSDYLRWFDDRQLLDELERRLAVATQIVDDSLAQGLSAADLSAFDDNLHDAVAAHEEEGPIAGEQEESDTP